MLCDNETVNQLFQAIPHIEAQEQIAQLKIADFPTMKKEARKTLFDSLKKLANPRIMKEERKALSIDDIAKILNEV